MRTEFNINIYNGCREELKFVYCKNVDKPENHFMHINKYCEIYVFVDGDANYIVEDMIFSLKKGDNVVLTGGPIVGASGNTNTIKVEQI